MCIIELQFVFLEMCIYIFVSFLPIRKEVGKKEGKMGRRDGRRKKERKGGPLVLNSKN